MSPNLPPVPSLPQATNGLPASPNALPLPNAMSGTPDLLQASGARVDGIAGALKATSNGLLSLLGPVAVLGLTWLGLKAIVLGKNPLKS